jgi:hypothetical protein
MYMKVYHKILLHVLSFLLFVHMRVYVQCVPHTESKSCLSVRFIPLKYSSVVTEDSFWSLSGIN